MKNIFTKFKVFENYLYNKIDEIVFSDHWKDRTNIEGNELSLSRALPLSKEESPWGFVIEEFIDASTGREIQNKDEVFDNFFFSEEEMEVPISYAINLITRSSNLEMWNPLIDKQYYLLDLGRIAVSKDDKKYYVKFKVLKDDEKQSYATGDKIFGFVGKDKEEKIKKNVGITIKYLPGDDNGLIRAVEEFRRDKNIAAPIFREKLSVEYPYGRNFEVVIDVSLSKEEQLRSIDSQVKLKERRKRIGAQKVFTSNPDN